MFHTDIQGNKAISFQWIAEHKRALPQVSEAIQAALTLGRYDLIHPVVWEVSLAERDAIWQVSMGES